MNGAARAATIALMVVQGIGLSVAAQINARALDKVYKHLKAKNGGVGKPEFRLRAPLPPPHVSRPH